jgi:ubiquinone biosynthesis protein Coq4
VNAAQRTRFRTLAQTGLSSGDVESLAKLCQNGGGSAEDRLAIAAALAHAAFAAPETIAATYDAAAQGWRGAPVEGPSITMPVHAAAPISARFWTAFDALVDPNRGPTSPGEVTIETAALGAELDPALKARSAEVALTYPLVREAAAHGDPPRFTLQALAACPAGSLGATFHSLIVDNGFDLEVLDRDALGLDTLPTPLGYLNARILQCHDLWHIVAGYETTALHEIGISAFQLAQFGHGYSAAFLATVAARTAAQPELFALMMDVILDAWRHGRQTPPMIAVAWESVWDQPVEAVRSRLGVEAFVSPYPADLFEQLRAA